MLVIATLLLAKFVALSLHFGIRFVFLLVTVQRVLMLLRLLFLALLDRSLELCSFFHLITLLVCLLYLLICYTFDQEKRLA